MYEELRKFKEFKISRKELDAAVGDTLWDGNFKHQETIYTRDVKDAIERYLKKDITQDILLEWVNTVWFTEGYEYADGEDDSIASVMDKLEEMDEDGIEYTSADFERMIVALENNEEFKL